MIAVESVTEVTPELVEVFERLMPQSHPTLPPPTRLELEQVVTGELLGVHEEGEGADTRIVNRSFLVSDAGVVVASYDKIHMFDVTLPDGKVIRESSAYRPGDKAVTADTPLGRVGLTICYDLRFPQLFRTLAQAGAQIITVPSSFQRQTGKAHWHALLQARAIENGCWIIAPAMCGAHAGNRQTFGHSLVVNPWGEVVADGG